MSKPLVVIIPHSLGRAEAISRLKSGLTKAATAQSFAAIEDEQWTADNRLEFRVRAMGQAITGAIDVADENARLEVTLPFLLAQFADTVTSMISQKAKALLEKK